MINLLLTATGTFNELSDLLANYWDKILAIVGGTAGATTIAILLVRWIGSLISAKIGKKNITLFLSKVAEFEQLVTNLPGTVNTAITGQLKKYENNLTMKFNNALKQYSDAKQAVYAKVVNENEKAEQVLKDLQSTTLELKTEIEPKVEEVVEIVETVTEQVADIIPTETEEITI